MTRRTQSGSPKKPKDTEQYTPDRLETMAKCLKELADDLGTKANAMRSDEIDSVDLGDAMVRRSYNYFLHFAAAVERAVDRHREGKTGRSPKVPW